MTINITIGNLENRNTRLISHFDQQRILRVIKEWSKAPKTRWMRETCDRVVMERVLQKVHRRKRGRT